MDVQIRTWDEREPGMDAVVVLDADDRRELILVLRDIQGIPADSYAL